MQLPWPLLTPRRRALADQDRSAAPRDAPSPRLSGRTRAPQRRGWRVSLLRPAVASEASSAARAQKATLLVRKVKGTTSHRTRALPATICPRRRTPMAAGQRARRSMAATRCWTASLQESAQRAAMRKRRREAQGRPRGEERRAVSRAEAPDEVPLHLPLAAAPSLRRQLPPAGPSSSSKPRMTTAQALLRPARDGAAGWGAAETWAPRRYLPAVLRPFLLDHSHSQSLSTVSTSWTKSLPSPSSAVRKVSRPLLAFRTGYDTHRFRLWHPIRTSADRSRSRVQHSLYRIPSATRRPVFGPCILFCQHRPREHVLVLEP